MHKVQGTLAEKCRDTGEKRGETWSRETWSREHWWGNEWGKWNILTIVTQNLSQKTGIQFQVIGHQGPPHTHTPHLDHTWTPWNQQSIQSEAGGSLTCEDALLRGLLQGHASQTSWRNGRQQHSTEFSVPEATQGGKSQHHQNTCFKIQNQDYGG